MSDELRKFTELDRVIYEPARMLIVIILYTIRKSGFSSICFVKPG